MHEKINEPIDVLARFERGRTTPLAFRWRNKRYQAKQLNFVHQEKTGNETIYYFSVSDDANFFRLAFFTRDLSWRLEELYYNG